jgi:hypothetical protein
MAMAIRKVRARLRHPGWPATESGTPTRGVRAVRLRAGWQPSLEVQAPRAGPFRLSSQCANRDTFRTPVSALLPNTLN